MILLINPKTTKVSEIHTDFFREPNSGLLYLTAVLDNEGIPVDIFDFEQYFDLTFNEQLSALINDIENYELFGISCLTNTYHLALKIAETIKGVNRDKIVTLGGPHVSFLFKEILPNQDVIDFICVGEAEESFLRLSKPLLMPLKLIKR